MFFHQLLNISFSFKTPEPLRRQLNPVFTSFKMISNLVLPLVLEEVKEETYCPLQWLEVPQQLSKLEDLDQAHPHQIQATLTLSELTVTLNLSLKLNSQVDTVKLMVPRQPYETKGTLGEVILLPTLNIPSYK